MTNKDRNKIDHQMKKNTKAKTIYYCNGKVIAKGAKTHW